MNDELVWTPEMVKRFWEFENQRPQNFFSHQVGEALIKFFRPYLKAGRILDYGGGLGFLTEDLLRRGYQCQIAEFGRETVNYLNNKFAASERFLGAIEVNELKKLLTLGSIRVIFLVEVIEHLDELNLELCLRSIKQILSIDDVLIITTPNDEDRTQSFIMEPSTGKLFHRWQHVRSWSEKTLSDKVLEYGFKPIKSGVCDFGCSFSALKRGSSLLFRIAYILAKRAQYIFNPSKKLPHLYMIAKKL